MGNKLTDTEHTILLYLFDALKIKPQDKIKLIDVVYKENGSDKYKSILDILKNSKDVVLDVDKLRTEMI